MVKDATRQDRWVRWVLLWVVLSKNKKADGTLREA